MNPYFPTIQRWLWTSLPMKFWSRPYNRRQVAGHPNYQQMISEMNFFFFFKEVVEKSLEKHSKCGQQQGPSVKLEANSGIFRSLLCVPKVRAADTKHIAAVSHRRRQKRSFGHLGFGRKKDYSKKQRKWYCQYYKYHNHQPYQIWYFSCLK